MKDETEVYEVEQGALTTICVNDGIEAVILVFDHDHRPAPMPENPELMMEKRKRGRHWPETMDIRKPLILCELPLAWACSFQDHVEASPPHASHG